MNPEAKRVRVRNDKPCHPCVCQICGKNYMSFKKTSQYCSNACKGKSKSKPLFEGEVEQALELYQSGLTWAQVEKTMNITPYRRREILAIIKSQMTFKSRADHKPNQTGENNDNWKGGRIKLSGYVGVKTPGHPRGRGANNGYVLEHILVMEAYLGRYITFSKTHHPDNEVVHHINGIRDDNRLENLVLMLAREHSYLHGNQKWAREILDATNNVIYPSFTEACEVAGLNENELATYIHFGWKNNGVLWKYATGQPITARIIEP